MDFKNEIEIYKNNSTYDNENRLLRTICYDTDFYVGVITENNNVYLDIIKDDRNKIIIKFFTNKEELKINDINKYSGLNLFNFQEIIELVNKHCIDEVHINPNTDNYLLTNYDIKVLERQMKFGKDDYKFRLYENKQFSKPAYRISELNSNSNQVIEIYKKYLENKTLENLNKFAEIFSKKSSFYGLVLPEDNARKDEQGHLLISNNRVLQNRLSDTSANYYLFISIKNMIDFIGADENSFVSIFYFDDYMNLIDNQWNRIESLRIIGDLDLCIPAEDLQEIKFIIDKNRMERSQISIKSTLDGKRVQLKDLIKKINNDDVNNN